MSCNGPDYKKFYDRITIEISSDGNPFSMELFCGLLQILYNEDSMRAQLNEKQTKLLILAGINRPKLHKTC